MLTIGPGLIGTSFTKAIASAIGCKNTFITINKHEYQLLKNDNLYQEGFFAHPNLDFGHHYQKEQGEIKENIYPILFWSDIAKECKYTNKLTQEEQRYLQRTGYITQEIQKAIRQSEMIILATPVEAVKKIVTRYLKDNLNKETIIIDLLSCKSFLEKDLIEPLKNTEFNPIENFVSCHPIAGSQKRGAKFADEKLFEGTDFIITPFKEQKNNPEYIKNSTKIIELINKIGAKVKILTPEKHDYIYSRTSHLVQLLSFVIKMSFKQSEIKKLPQEYSEFLRLTGSSWVVWRGIFDKNSQEITTALEALNINNKLKETARYLIENSLTLEALPLERQFHIEDDIISTIKNLQEEIKNLIEQNKLERYCGSGYKSFVS